MLNEAGPFFLVIRASIYFWGLNILASKIVSGSSGRHFPGFDDNLFAKFTTPASKHEAGLELDVAVSRCSKTA